MIIPGEVKETGTDKYRMMSLLGIKKWMQMNIFTKEKQINRLRKETEGVWGELAGSGQYIHLKTGAVVVQSLSRVQLCATPRTVAHQVPLPMGVSRQEYWSGLPFPPPGDLPDPGIEPVSPALTLTHWTED